MLHECPHSLQKATLKINPVATDNSADQDDTDITVDAINIVSTWP